MGFTAINGSQGRYSINSRISKSEIEKLLRIKNLKVIQFAGPAEKSVWQNIETILLQVKPKVEIRVYGFYGEVCNLEFLEYIPSAENFSADCLMDAINIDKLTKLKNLKTLGVDIYNLENFEFLNSISSEIRELFIGRTRSRKPDLSPISRFKKLKYLYIEGHSKGIDAIAELAKLEKVVLRSISMENVNFLKFLKHLWSVEIKLGGIKNFEALEKMAGIKYLELWQIRKLANIDFISNMYDLQYLFLQSLPNIKKLPDFLENKKLRKIYLENLNGLSDLKSLEFVPKLEEFIFVNCSKLQPAELLPVLKNKNLRFATAGFGSDKRNILFKELAKEFNKQQYKNEPFVFE